jgi:large subunit ribosomal protein L13
MKTYSAKATEIERRWYVVDADGVVLGRLASEIARRLRGKHKPSFTPHVDCGDNIIVVNADKVRLTGRKLKDRVFYWHTGYPGGIKAETFESLRERRPEAIIERAIRGMLPKNKLGRKQLKKLKIYRGSDHLHQSQNPEALNIQ